MTTCSGYNEATRGSISESSVGLHRILTIVAVLALSVLAFPSSRAVDLSHKIEELNYYEWTAVAPVVITGTSLGENGRYIEFRVNHALRGPVEPGEMIRIDLKYANRNRRRSDYPRALKLP